MPLETAQREWIATISGLAVQQKALNKKRDEKDGRAREMGVKLDLAKEGIRSDLTITIKRKGILPGKLKTLEEEGGQMDEFDISDANKYQLKPEDLAQMSGALARVEKIAAEMREAKTELIDEATGKPALDKSGKPIMVPLYTDDEITEEVYMPLVRERLIPESMVPGKFSKTQQMIEASDKLYQERLKEYTEATEKDPDHLETLKVFGDKLGDIGERAAKMFPGEDAKLAASAIGLAKLAFTTSVTAAQVLSKKELDGMSNQVIDSIGKIAGGIVAVAVSPEVGKQVEKLYGAAVTGPKIAVHLLSKPPKVDAAIEELAKGLESAIGAGLQSPSPTQTVIVTTVCMAIRNSARVPRLKTAIEDGNRNAVIDEFNGLAKDMLKSASSLSSTIGKDQGTVDPKQVEEISRKLDSSFDTLSNAAKLTGIVADAVVAKQITKMAQEIVDGLGKVLNGAVGTFAPAPVAKQVAAAYTSVTSVSMVAYYLSLEQPDQGRALAALAKGFSGSLALASPDDPAAKKLGGIVEMAIVNAGKGVDFAKAIQKKDYPAAVKQMNSITSDVLKKAFSGQDLELAEGVAEGVNDIASEIAKFKDTLAKNENAEELEARVNELRGQLAMEEIEANKQDVRNALVQRDESGKEAAELRSIENLIKEMVKDRMMMELATQLVSGGIGVVAKFVPVLGTADAAIGLAVNLMKAADRAMELNKWINNQKDMKKSVSSFESSAMNFVKNQAEQFSHYSIQAACKLAQMIGEIVKCSGLASAAGEAVSKGAALASAAEELSYQFYKEADLLRAWKVTKKAWAHPESRKLQLVARKMNPTLAKYTLAWGAAVKRDPLAMEAMATCGLNELTLSDPGSNVNKVQAYLETMFNEDNVVLRRVVTPDWMPETVVFSARCWGVAKSRGVKEGDLLDEPTGAIDESIAQVEIYKVELEQAEKVAQRNKSDNQEPLYALAEARTKFIDALEAAQKSLQAYSPKTAKGKKVHHEMRELVDEFANQASVMQAEAEAADVEMNTVSLQKMFEEAE